MNLEQLNDEELMGLYQKGNLIAFETLYGRHQQKVYSYLQKRLSDEAQVAECFQEVFLKLHRFKMRYNKDFPFTAWLFRICKNTHIDFLRSQSKHSGKLEFEENLHSPTFSEPENQISSEDLLKNVSGSNREIIEMRYLQEMGFDEIAKALNTNNQNVRKKLSRSISTLKLKLGGKIK